MLQRLAARPSGSVLMTTAAAAALDKQTDRQTERERKTVSGWLAGGPEDRSMQCQLHTAAASTMPLMTVTDNERSLAARLDQLHSSRASRPLKLAFHGADTDTDTDTDSPNTATVLRPTHAREEMACVGR